MENKIQVANYFTQKLIDNHITWNYDTMHDDAAACIADVTWDSATIATGKNTVDASVNAFLAENGQTYTLTVRSDTATAAIFNADLDYTPGGDDRVNTLQSEDRLTGTSAATDTLNVTIGNRNDNGNAMITPTMTSVEVANVVMSHNDGTGLDLQDAAGLTTVNVTRIASGGSDIQNMQATATTLSAANTQAVTDVSFTYVNGALSSATDATNLTVSNVTAANLVVGTESILVDQLETLNLTVAAASSALAMNLRSDSVPTTAQTINITANSAFVLGNDIDQDGDVIEHNNGLGTCTAGGDTVYGTADDGYNAAHAGIGNITVTGSGNVTLGAVGSSNDFVLAAGSATGNIAANITNSQGDDLSTFTTGSGNDTLLSGGALSGDVVTNAGNDTVTITGNLANTENANGVDTAASISAGEGNDTVTVVGVVENNAAITAGAGDDTVTLGRRAVDTQAGPPTTPAVAGGINNSAAAEDVDGNVDLGAGADTLVIVNGTINGDVAGGTEADTLTLEAIDDQAIAEETTLAPNNGSVTGIETLNLTAAFAYLDAGNNDTQFIETDDNDTTADFTVDLAAFDSDLTQINIANQDRATFAANGVDAEDGDDITVTLTNFNNEGISITSEEGDRTAAGTAVKADTFSDAGGYSRSIVTDFAADVTLNVTHASTATMTALALSLTGDNNYDVTIVDGNAAANDMDNLTMTVTGAGSHGINLSDDFDTALTVTGGGTGDLTIINVQADTITTTAHTGRVFLDIDSNEVHTINTGDGNDIVDMRDDTFATTDAMNLGDGTDRVVVATTLGNNASGDDEVFEGIVSIEEVELANGADIMLADDAFATGITRVIAMQSTDIRTNGDFTRALTVDMDQVDGTVTMDNDGNTDLTFNINMDDQVIDANNNGVDDNAGAAALDRILTFTDAGTGTTALNVTLTGGVPTEIEAAAAATAANSELQITVNEGAIDSITLVDSNDQDDDGTLDADEGVSGLDNAAVTITVDDTWASGLLTINAGAIADNDSTRTDGTVSTTTGGATINAVAELDADITITGTANDDTITGGDDTDTITGNGGNDTFVYTFANANDSTSQSADTITDFNAGDIITVDAGTLATNQDFIATFASVVYLDEGDNSLGGSPDDADVANDLVAGDLFFSAALNQLNIDVDGNGDIQDGIDLSINVAGFTESQLRYTVTAHAGGSTITTGAGNDTITGGALVDYIAGGAGVDTIDFTANAGNGNVLVLGNSDSGLTLTTMDTIKHFETDDVIHAGIRGESGVNYSESEADYDDDTPGNTNGTINATEFAAVLTAANTALATLAAVDPSTDLEAFTLIRDTDTDTEWLFNDTDGNGTADQAIIMDLAGLNSFDAANLSAGAMAGSANADVIVGTTVADTITGLAGADIITGGEGADNITGGAGLDTIQLVEETAAADTVVFTTAGDGGTTGANGAGDTITGFVAANDGINIDGALQTAVDDIGGANATFAWGTAAGGAGVATAMNVTSTVEAINVLDAENGGAAAVTAANLTDLTAVANLLEQEITLTAAAGDDAIVLVESSDVDGTFGVYYYLETGGTANNFDAADLTLLGIVTGDAVTTADIFMA